MTLLTVLKPSAGGGGGGGGASIAYGGAGTQLTVTTATNSWAVPYPSPVSANDLLILHIATSGGTVTTPSGWNAVYNETVVTNPKGGLFWKRATGSETGNLTVAITSTTGAAQIHRYTGVDTTTALDAASTSVSLNATTDATIDLPAITTVTDNAWYIYAGASNSSTVLHTGSAGDNERADFGVGKAGALYDGIQAVAGSTGVKTITQASARAYWGAMLVLRPSGVSGPPAYAGSADFSGSATLTASGSGGAAAGTASLTATGTLSATGDIASTGITFLAGTPAESTASVTSITPSISFPSLIDGDYILLICTSNASGGGFTNIPLGWDALVDNIDTDPAISASGHLAIFYRKWVSGDTDPTITFTSGRVGVLPVRVRGADPNDFTGLGPNSFLTNTATTSVTAPGYIPVEGTVLAAVFMGRSNTNGAFITWTPPAGMTEIGEAGGKAPTQTNSSVSLAVKTVPIGVQTGDQTATASSNTNGAIGTSFMLKPAPSTTDKVATAGLTGSATLSAVGSGGTPVLSVNFSASGTLSAAGIANGTTPALVQRIVGMPGASSAIVSVKVTNSTSVRLKVSTDSAGTTGVIYGNPATPGVNGDAKLTVSGLTPGINYYYRVAMTGAGGEIVDSASTIGRLKAAPTTQTNFAFNFGSCTSQGDSASMAAIAARGDDLFIHLGDLYYADGSGTGIDNFRTKFNQKITVANHAAVFSTTPSTYTPSDHDGMNNNVNAGTDPTAWANWKTVYNELFPAPDTYYSFTYGRVQFLQIDRRNYADNPALVDNSSKTCLGATQKQWLKDQITNSTAAAIVICQADPWIGAASAGDDAWLGYSTERTELANHFSSSGKNIVILGGDMHALAADDGTNSPGGAPVFMASPMYGTSSIKGGPYSAGTYPTTASVSGIQQYGRVVVTDTGNQISFAFTGYSSDNTSRLIASKTFTVTTASNYTGSANFTGSGTLSSGATVTATGSANFTGAGTLSRTATLTASSSANLTGSGTLSQSAAFNINNSANTTGSGTLTVSAVSNINGSANLTGSGTLTRNTTAINIAGSGNLSGSGTLTVSTATNINAAANFSGSGTETVTTAFNITGSANPTGSGTLSVITSLSQSQTANLTGSGTLGSQTSSSGTGVFANTATGTLSSTAAITQSRTASLTGSGTLSSSNIVGLPGNAITFSGTGTLSALGTVSNTGTANFTGSGVLSTSAQITQSRTASLTGSGTLSAVGVMSFTTTAALSGTGTLSPIGISNTQSGTANYNSTGTLSASASAITQTGIANFSGSGSLGTQSATSGSGTFSNSATGTLSTSATPSVPNTVTLSATGTLSTSGTAAFTVNANASGLGTLSQASIANISRTANTTSTGTLSVVAISNISVTAQFASNGTLTRTSSYNINQTGTLSGSGSLSASNSGLTVTTAANFTGSGSLNTQTAGSGSGSLSTSATGTLSVTATSSIATTANLTGAGNLTGTQTAITNSRSVNFTATGSLSSSTSSSSGTSASFTGTGTLSVVAVSNFASTANFVGSGTLSSVSAITISNTIANLSGSGTLSTASSNASTGNASFTGAGTLTASGISNISRVANLSGSGTLAAAGSISNISRTASLTASGTLSAVATSVTHSTIANFTGAGILGTQTASAGTGAFLQTAIGTLSTANVQIAFTSAVDLLSSSTLTTNATLGISRIANFSTGVALSLSVNDLDLRQVASFISGGTLLGTNTSVSVDGIANFTGLGYLSTNNFISKDDFGLFTATGTLSATTFVGRYEPIEGITVTMNSRQYNSAINKNSYYSVTMSRNFSAAITPRQRSNQ